MGREQEEKGRRNKETRREGEDDRRTKVKRR